MASLNCNSNSNNKWCIQVMTGTMNQREPAVPAVTIGGKHDQTAEG